MLKLCFYLNLLFRFHFFVNVSWYPQASYALRVQTKDEIEFTQETIEGLINDAFNATYSEDGRIEMRKYKDNDDVDIIFKVTNTPSNIEYGLVTW